MKNDAAEKIKKLFLEDENFRKEFITNTKSILDKYGVEIGDETPIEFKQTGKLGEVKPMKCIVISSQATPQGFLICDF